MLLSRPFGSSLCLLAAATLALASGIHAEPAHDDIEPGDTAPAFSAARLGGEAPPIALDDLRGHVVLLNFWALNCPPCRIEMPELERLHRRYEPRGLRLVGVTQMNPAEDEAARFIREIGVSYPIVLDPGMKIGDRYGLVAHPTSVLIDARGIVRFVNQGYIRGDEKLIERAVRSALAGEAPR